MSKTASINPWVLSMTIGLFKKLGITHRYVTNLDFINLININITCIKTGLEISVGYRTMTGRNKCLTDLKLLQSDIVSERKIKTDKVFI